MIMKGKSNENDKILKKIKRYYLQDTITRYYLQFTMFLGLLNVIV